MVQYYPNNPKTITDPDSGTDTEDFDPGREILERNKKEHMKRMADFTKEELDKVLKRVDNVGFIHCFFSISYVIPLDNQ